ncbi:Zinc finger, PHD-type domain and Zinc finger, FYVE/PHD-type domain and Zinc finger, RING/FYVE/PHD-type domain-containing protein [Strongyloides ratti]|uniref:Zinc finger, PHD-type domain and Zinc finger, FYVE/PHD-type domain and Zinc finger, RING/FYVE/PHD-type domain-containing protein n=1 Tax=Strongyloides ratti TaxID=34506 RepID=A0A090N0I2_STRRB|nr:Zinc finger, PHD-type domain and Zinc finger, FYVE/PHD-type domain and Zinc finger, RING/FYVE/PHD-type domain-containing protein [Strongyloides ratti]CEF70733.1 Zinc finger, PHD-type domain and Zinc finger, FYVE/PHD-type domain and Zinc finger, RING/FYVE/PHD-type domain-containing protein [Strongyloides ratti]
MDNEYLQKINGKENCGKDKGSFVLNDELDDANWKFSHILSEPGPSHIKQSKDEILNTSKESLYERVKRRTRNVAPKYVEECIENSKNNSTNTLKKKKTVDYISMTDNNINAKKTCKRFKSNIIEETQNEEVIKNKRVCKKRSPSICITKKTIANNTQIAGELSMKEKELSKKETTKKEIPRKITKSNETKQTTDANQIKESGRENSILQEHQYNDINVENIITGKRRRKTVQTYDINVLTTYQDAVKKETVSQKKVNQGQKKFHGYIDSLLKKNIIDSEMAEEFKKLCIKKIKVPREPGYINDCTVKEDEKGGIPPCVVCNEISDVVLRCRWCRDAYHWVCYPIRLFKYTFPKRPWRCINCHLKNITKEEISDIKKSLRTERCLARKTGDTKKLSFFEKLNNNINVYDKLHKKPSNIKMKYYNLLVNVIDKPPCDFDDDSFSDSSDDDIWYRNSLYPNGLFGSLRNCCYLCLKPETEVKHIMKCTFCSGQYHCDCLTPPFCYTPLDDFNCGYHINEPKKEPNLLSYSRVLDAINKYNDGGFKSNIEFELEFRNAVKQIEREEKPRVLKRPKNFCRNVPIEVERYYTSQFAKLLQHFELKDTKIRNILKQKLEDDVYDIYNQYEQLYFADDIEKDNDELKKQFALTNIVLKYVLKVSLKAFIIRNKDSKIDVKINRFPYNNCCEIKDRMVDIKYIPTLGKYELFVLGRYPVFVNGILIGKDRLSSTSNGNCGCQKYFKLKDVSKAFMPSVFLKSGDIIRIGCCVILFGHA